MDEKNSNEKVNTMQLMGAEVLKLKGGEMEVARQIKERNHNTVMVDQVFIISQIKTFLE